MKRNEEKIKNCDFFVPLVYSTDAFEAQVFHNHTATTINWPAIWFFRVKDLGNRFQGRLQSMQCCHLAKDTKTGTWFHTCTLVSLNVLYTVITLIRNVVDFIIDGPHEPKSKDFHNFTQDFLEQLVELQNGVQITVIKTKIQL